MQELRAQAQDICTTVVTRFEVLFNETLPQARPSFCRLMNEVCCDIHCLPGCYGTRIRAKEEDTTVYLLYRCKMLLPNPTNQMRTPQAWHIEEGCEEEEEEDLDVADEAIKDVMRCVGDDVKVVQLVQAGLLNVLIVVHDALQELLLRRQLQWLYFGYATSCESCRARHTYQLALQPRPSPSPTDPTPCNAFIPKPPWSRQL